MAPAAGDDAVVPRKGAGGGGTTTPPPPPPAQQQQQQPLPPPPPPCAAQAPPPPARAPPYRQPAPAACPSEPPDGQLAAAVPAVEWCHRCTARSSETVLHVFECSAAQPELRRLHGAVAAAVRDALVGWHISLPPADDRLPLPPAYADYPLAAALFWFDPVLAAAARRARLVPGAARCTSPLQLRAVRAMAALSPLAGLLGVWPVHMHVALAVWLGLPDPAACRPLRRVLRALVARLRTIVVTRAFRIYVARCYAERDWEAAGGCDESWRARRSRTYHSRAWQLRRQAAAVLRGAPPPAATWTSSKPKPAAKRAPSRKHTRQRNAKRVRIAAPDVCPAGSSLVLRAGACSPVSAGLTPLRKRARALECAPTSAHEMLTAGPPRKQRRGAVCPVRVYDLRPRVRAARQLAVACVPHASAVRKHYLRLF